MLGQFTATWLIPVAIGVAVAVASVGVVAALAVPGRRIRAWARRRRTIQPGVWWV